MRELGGFYFKMDGAERSGLVRFYEMGMNALERCFLLEVSFPGAE